jgi:tetratricopeptide (TPR) repeat protein
MKADARDHSRELAAGLMNAVQLLRDGQDTRAMDQCRALLERFPGSPDVLRYLGLAEVHAQRFAEAEAHLTEALRQQPDSANLLNDLGIVRLRQQAWEEAADSFTRALDVDPNHADALGNIAVLFGERSQPARARPYLQRLTRIRPFSGTAFAKAARNSLLLDDANEALRLGRKAVRLMPELADARLTLAEALEATGRFRQAKFQYLAILRRDPRHVNALTRLLSMKRTSIDTSHAADARELIDSGQLQPPEQAQLHLALARYLDQRQQYDAAFEHLTAGNAISWKKQAFDSALFSRAADGIMAVFTEEFFRRRSVHGAESKRPIFIVGMPRSGTTLVEQILASHPAVAAGGELSTIPNLAAEVGRVAEPYPHGIRRLDGGMLERLATRYLERLDNVSQEAAHVTDKLPFNYMHLGLIGTLFPDAAVIHCRRDPLDTCLSCYFTSFGDNLLFAGELTALGRYYVDYRRMMDHWRRALPKPPLDVQYERLVDDTEGTVKSILAFCGLGWDPACMSFYRTDRGIRTPSRWQVRQPVYSDSIGRWRHYERYLQPLRHIVVPAASEESVRS